MDEDKRSCFLCKHSRMCIIFRNIYDNTGEVRMNIDGDAAPGKWSDIFDAVGNCCLEYEKNE